MSARRHQLVAVVDLGGAEAEILLGSDGLYRVLVLWAVAEDFEMSALHGPFALLSQALALVESLPDEAAA
jgi:hypothetical protein